MDTLKSLIINELHIFHACLKWRNLLRFCLLLLILLINQPVLAEESGENREVDLADNVIEAAGAKIFAEQLATVSDEKTQPAARADNTNLKGMSLHEAFIARMDRVVENVVGVRAVHFDQQSPNADGQKAPPVEMLPEVRVFSDVMAEQGPESRIYASLAILAGMVASEEKGKLGYQVTPEEMERRPDLADQGFKVGDWLRKPALYEKVSKGLEGALKRAGQNPELVDQIEWGMEHKMLPLIDSLTEESMSLGGVLRHFSEDEEFKDIENLHGKLSAFAKVSYLAAVNDWAAQNDLPQLDLNKHLPEEFTVTMAVGEKVPADQLQFARKTVATISPDNQTPVDKSAISNPEQAQKILAESNSR